MGQTKEQRMIKELGTPAKSSDQVLTPIATNMYLPNYSGLRKEALKTTAERITHTATQTIINNAGDDIDVLVKSDTLTPLFIDGGNGRVGINTITPIKTFQFHTIGTDEMGVITTDTNEQGASTDGSGVLFDSIYTQRPRITPVKMDGTSTTSGRLVLLRSEGQEIHMIDSNRAIQAATTGGGGTGSYINFGALSGFRAGCASNTGVGLDVYVPSSNTNDAFNVTAGATYGNLMTIKTAGNVGINETEPDYKLDVNGTFGFTPGTSVTPADNGDVVIEATNDTTLTFKLKGSDGTVRSATLTLA